MSLRRLAAVALITLSVLASVTAQGKTDNTSFSIHSLLFLCEIYSFFCLKKCILSSIVFYVVRMEYNAYIIFFIY